VNNHPTEATLALFAACELGENLAIHVAEHLDHCPACSARVTAMDPLQNAFAASIDPPLPPGLTAAILREATSTPRRAARVSEVETMVGLAMLLLAALTTMMAVDPIGLTYDIGQTISALQTGLSHLPMGASWSVWMSLSTATAAVGFVVLIGPSRPSGTPL
jgi:anti-sigma factor RsiW